jgi:hypothetical protein
MYTLHEKVRLPARTWLCTSPESTHKSNTTYICCGCWPRACSRTHLPHGSKVAGDLRGLGRRGRRCGCRRGCCRGRRLLHSSRGGRLLAGRHLLLANHGLRLGIHGGALLAVNRLRPSRGLRGVVATGLAVDGLRSEVAAGLAVRDGLGVDGLAISGLLEDGCATKGCRATVFCGMRLGFICLEIGFREFGYKDGTYVVPRTQGEQASRRQAQGGSGGGGATKRAVASAGMGRRGAVARVSCAPDNNAAAAADDDGRGGHDGAGLLVRGRGLRAGGGVAAA